MHERYFYLADVVSVLYALESPRLWYIPTLVVTASLSSYANYLKHSYSSSGFYYIALDERFLAGLIFIGILCTIRELAINSNQPETLIVQKGR